MPLNSSSLSISKESIEQDRQLGYVQLIDEKTNEVIQQRVGFHRHVEYCANNVWVVLEGFKVIFSLKSDLCQPNKFFHPIKKDTIVRLYDDYLDAIPPKDIPPTWIGRAFELDSVDVFIVGNTWNAFTQDNEWIGTSEY